MATIYIWPGATFDGDGTAATQANTGGGVGARNTVPTLTANNTYRFKRGTTYSHVNGVRPLSQVSAATTPLTIEAYYNDDGTDDVTQALPVVNHLGGSNGLGAIFVDQCTNAIVRNMRGINSRASNNAGIKVRGSSGVTITGCQGDGNIFGIDITVAAIAAGCTDIVVDGNTVFGNDGSGIRYEYGSASNFNIKRLRITRNRVYNNGLATVTTHRRGGIMHQCSRADGAGNTDSHTSQYGVFGLQITDNEVYSNRSYAIAAYCVHPDPDARQANVIARNRVAGNGYDGLLDSHAIWLGGSRGVLIEENTVYANIGQTGASVGTSVGIFIDFNSAIGAPTPSGGNHVVRGNVCRSGWLGPTVANIPGSGIHVLSNESCKVVGNIVHGFMGGMTNSGADSSNNTYRGNTVKGIRRGQAPTNQTGRGMTVTTGANVTVENNIFTDCEQAGIHVDTTGPTGFVERYNVVYNCTTPRTNGTTAAPTPTSLDGTDKTTDPLLTERHSVPTISPAYRAGVHVEYGVDHFGATRWNPPSIGAVEAAPLRTSR